MFCIKGYLVAWAVHMFDFWLKNHKILKDLVCQSLPTVCDGYQLRHNGLGRFYNSVYNGKGTFK